MIGLIKKYAIQYVICAVVLFVAYFLGNVNGISYEREKWEIKQAKQLQSANQALLDHALEKQQYEDRLEAASANILNLFKQRTKQHEKRVKHITRGLNDGSIQLRDTAIQPSISDTATTSQAAINTRERYVRAQGRFSRQDALFLVDYGAEADRVVYQLEACQQRLKLCVTNPATLTKEP